MLSKLLGAVLILAAFALEGKRRSSCIQKRIKALSGLEQGLLSLEREIAYLSTPLALALEHAAVNAEAAAEIFSAAGRLMNRQRMPAEQAWREAIKSNLYLQSAELSALSRFAADLGLSDKNIQLKKLELTRLSVSDIRKAAVSSAAEQIKLLKGLTISAAVTLIILLF
ncbi:MAG: stage III sporulation protein AB [Clostridia bacterium]|nr:stage III sporulation protein AB [Clostridia bacterium]MDD4798887.1 stage III sporulation protein AB [Clostridia bacterium]